MEASVGLGMGIGSKAALVAEGVGTVADLVDLAAAGVETEGGGRIDLDELATTTGPDDDAAGAGAETSEILAFFFLGSWTGRDDLEAGVADLGLREATDGEGAGTTALVFEVVGGTTISGAATPLDFLDRFFLLFGEVSAAAWEGATTELAFEATGAEEAAGTGAAGG